MFPCRTPLLSFDDVTFRIDLPLSLPNDAVYDGAFFPLLVQPRLLRIQFTIALITFLFVLRISAICPTGGLLIAGAGAGGPAREPVTPLFEGRAPCGNLRILDQGLGIAVIGVNAQRDEEVADDVLLLRPAGGVHLGQGDWVARVGGGHDRDELGLGRRAWAIPGRRHARVG